MGKLARAFRINEINLSKFDVLQSYLMVSKYHYSFLHAETDSLKRLYSWKSIVSHPGYRTDEYVIWFIYIILYCIAKVFPISHEYSISVCAIVFR
jgi:hypothetical protein